MHLSFDSFQREKYKLASRGGRGLPPHYSTCCQGHKRLGEGLLWILCSNEGNTSITINKIHHLAFEIIIKNCLPASCNTLLRESHGEEAGSRGERSTGPSGQARSSYPSNGSVQGGAVPSTKLKFRERLISILPYLHINV